MNTHLNELQKKNFLLRNNVNLSNQPVSKVSKENKKSQNDNQTKPKTLKMATLINPKSLFPHFILFETAKLKKCYLQSIVKHEISKHLQGYRTDLLINHKITPEIRCRMVF